MASRFTPLRTAIPILIAALVFFLPLDLEPAGRRVLAIATWMVLSWILEPLHPVLVGFAGCFLFWVLGRVQFDIAFSGFATETPWFLYGALILVGAASRTGIVRRLGAFIPGPARGSFAAAAVTLALIGLAAGAVIPSAAARAVVLVLIALALSGELTRSAGANTRLPLVAVASYAAAVLGADGGQAAPPLAWRLVTVVIVVGVAAWFVRPQEEPPAAEPEPLEGADRIAVLLAVAVLAWATTSLHGISPALVGLTVGLLAVMPGFRPKGETGEPRTDPLAVIVAGTALSVPMALVETKAVTALATGLEGWVSATGSVISASMAAYWGYVVAALFAPAPTSVDMVAARTTLAASTGLSAQSLDWIATCASTAKLAVYQSPALILGAAVGGFVTRDVLKFGLALALIGGLAAVLLA